MTDELQSRRHEPLGGALVDMIDGIDLPPAPGLTGRSDSARRRSRGLMAGIAAALLLVAVVLGAPFAARSLAPAPALAGPGQTLPAELPNGDGWWTLPQSWSPLSRIAMTWYEPDGDDGSDLAVGNNLRSVRKLGDRGGLISPDGRRLAYSKTDGQVTVEDLETGETASYRVPADGDTVPRDWAPDSRMLYLGARDSAGVWVTTPGGGVEPVPAARITTNEMSDVDELDASPDGVHLAIAGWKTDLRIVDRRVPAPASGSGAQVVKGVQGQPLFTPSGRSVVVVPFDVMSYDKAHLWVVDTATRKTRRMPYGSGCIPVVMLTERQLLCSGDAATKPGQSSADSGLSVLDIETGERNVVARTHDSLVFVQVADDLARTWTFSMSRKWYPADG